MPQTGLAGTSLALERMKGREGVLTAIAIAAAILLFWKGFASLLEAWSRPEYSHGYFIPLLAIYLALRQWLAAGKRTDVHSGFQWLGPAITVFGILIGLFGNLASIPDIVTYGMLFTVGGLLLTVFGFRAGMIALPAWVYLWFMLPLPNVIYWPLSIRLQFISSEIGVAMIKALNIPVYLDGNIIDLGHYQLQVAEACSGLRYLFPLMSFGFLFAVLYQGRLMSKIIIFLSSIPITILMNSVRIAIVGVLVSNYGNEQAEGFQHFFEGWVVFIVCLALLYGVALLMRRIMRDGRPGSPLIDMPTSGLLAAVPSLSTERVRSGMNIAVAALVIGATLSIAASYRPPQHIDRKPLDSFPMELGEGRGTPQFLDSQILSILGADDYLMADYAMPEGQPPVSLLVSYYLSQTQGSGIHSPEVCIPAGGWEVSTWSRAEINLPEANGGPFTVNKAIIQKGLDRQLVYYWFEQRGRRLPSDYVAKLLTIWDSIVMGRSDGALVRLTTPVDGRGLPAAEQRLQAFAGHLMTELNAYVPQ